MKQNLYILLPGTKRKSAYKERIFIACEVSVTAINGEQRFYPFSEPDFISALRRSPALRWVYP